MLLGNLPTTGNPVSDVTLVGVLILAVKELVTWLKTDKQSDETMVKEFIADLKAENRAMKDGQTRSLEEIYKAIGSLRQQQRDIFLAHQQLKVDITGVVANDRSLREMIILLGNGIKKNEQMLSRLHERIDALQRSQQGND